MAEIICPMCGKPNPPDLQICQFCEARLKPMTDELSRSQPPIHPGDEPTQKATAELEPVLPQWLRQVRQQARESAEEEAKQSSTEEEAPPPEAEDLLAGLQPQPEEEEEEEVPDWLTSLRGEQAPSSAEENPAGPAKENLQAGEGSVESLPGWISDLGPTPAEVGGEKDELSARLTGSAKEESAPVEKSSSAPTTDLSWRAGLDSDFRPEAETTDPALLNIDLPDWLKPTEKERLSAGDEERQIEAEEAPAFSEEESQPSGGRTMTDWLASLSKETTSQPESPAPSVFAKETPPASAEATPDWLASFGEEMTPQPESPAPAAFTGEPTQNAAEDIPDWLVSFGEETTPQPESPAPAAFVEEQEETQLPASGETPARMTSFNEETVGPARPAKEQFKTAAFEPGSEELVQDGSGAPAFVDDEGTPMSSGDLEAMFSLEMPDWLSDVSSAGQGESATIPGAGHKDDLSPAELPSWVQAMRPVEAVLSEGGEETFDQTVEERGPLAGLRGVLPSALGAAPSSKPKAYTLKLQTSEEQRTNATLLEQLLVGETYPSPMTTQPVAFSQRFLRQIVALVVLIAVAAPIFSGTQINPVPYSVPLETNAAKQLIETNLLPDAPVLVIFDYEAALTGELEAAAAPLVDYMVLLKHPRLALIASTPVGAGLSERFMKLENTQVATYYQSGQLFVNLGFLPGGAAGVLAFAENPVATKPISMDGQNAWETPALQGVQQLAEFAAIILLTDDAESARTWIEQTEGKSGQAYLLVVSSAQAGPMLQPYVQSGQIDGLVTGLGSSTPIEQINSGRPGLGRIYWDAYGLGLLTAVVMISLGSLWNLASNWRLRKAKRGT